MPWGVTNKIIWTHFVLWAFHLLRLILAKDSIIFWLLTQLLLAWDALVFEVWLLLLIGWKGKTTYVRIIVRCTTYVRRGKWATGAARVLNLAAARSCIGTVLGTGNGSTGTVPYRTGYRTNYWDGRDKMVSSVSCSCFYRLSPSPFHWMCVPIYERWRVGLSSGAFRRFLTFSFIFWVER